MLRTCRIENYRSVRRLVLDLEPITVLIGANGTGKTNCYRALELIQAAAAGRLGEHFASEGGMPSALWAGERERGELRLAVTVEHDEFTYRLACGLPVPKTYGQPADRTTRHIPLKSHFVMDAEVKEEDVSIPVAAGRRPVPLCERRHTVCTLRDTDGGKVLYRDPLDPGESVMAQITDPRQYGELALIRESLVRWRFYHQFRSDPQSALRLPRLGTRSPILAGDGANLAAALQTIIEMDGEERLTAILADALPGHALVIERDDHGRMAVAMRKPGIHRTLGATELSDGTLRFLCLAAALLSPRPPRFLVVNEPETSLHPDLLPGLAALIVDAGKRAQVLVTTHSQTLAEAVTAASGVAPQRLVLSPDGETNLVGDRGLRR